MQRLKEIVICLSLILFCFAGQAAGQAGTTIPAPVDEQLPRLVDVSLFPDVVDTTGGTVWILVVVHLSDVGAGVTGANLLFEPRDGSQGSRAVAFYPENLQAGNIHNGYYSGRLMLPQLSAPGEWILSRVYVGDRAGNYSYTDDRSGSPYRGISFWNGPYVAPAEEAAPIFYFLPLMMGG